MLNIYKILTVAGLLSGTALVWFLSLANILDADQIALPTQKITPDEPAIIAAIPESNLELKPKIILDPKPEIKMALRIEPAAPASVAKPQLEEQKIANLLNHLRDLSVTERKREFFSIIIPLVAQANQGIMENRKRLISLKDQNNISVEDQSWLSKMYSYYRIQNENIDLLLLRIDIVPNSLAVSQAVIESGWGTSRFAQEGNALFGQHNYSGIGGMKVNDNVSFTIVKFDSILDSVRGYMRNLNTHRAYTTFREKRAHMRQHSQELDGSALAKTLDKYSERGYRYINDVVSVIRTNNLS